MIEMQQFPLEGKRERFVLKAPKPIYPAGFYQLAIARMTVQCEGGFSIS